MVFLEPRISRYDRFRLHNPQFYTFKFEAKVKFMGCDGERSGRGSRRLGRRGLLRLARPRLRLGQLGPFSLNNSGTQWDNSAQYSIQGKEKY